ncbi:MAG: HAD family hydrolase [Candidatus Moranbacteria bacterium]|nr:HAD family hydrolase [Candidatus Moranbacteria bacterium]
MAGAVIFGFDGVIHDTFRFHLERVRKFFGIELTEQEYRDMQNGNFYRCVPEKLHGADWVSYREYVAKEFMALRTEDGVAEVLRSLSESVGLHIVSAGGTRIIEGYLRNNGLREMFVEVIGGDIHPSKTHGIGYIRGRYGQPDDRVLFVSDTLGDILAARETGVVTVAIDSGYHDRETLRRGNPHHLISELGELLGLMREWSPVPDRGF